MRRFILSALVAALFVPGCLIAQATQFAELAKYALPNLRDNIEAAALGDVDGDGDLDVVFGSWGQHRLYLNNGIGRFADATSGRMPPSSGVNYAVVLCDLDGDKDNDLVFGNNGTQNSIYINDGKGRFADESLQRLPVDSNKTIGIAMGDVDRDGDVDIVFGNEGQQNRLYLNNGKGQFKDVTGSNMPRDSDLSLTVVFGDVDGDKDLDLLVGNTTQQNRLYLNDGQGKFTDATTTNLPSDSARTAEAVFCDVDGDGDLDAVFGNGWVGRTGQRNSLYLNNGLGRFTDATASKMPAVIATTVHVAVADLDLDGDFDLVFGNRRDRNRLYLNDGKGNFTDATTKRLPLDSDNTMRIVVGDVDHDGDTDLLAANQGAQQNRLYLNRHRHVYSPTVAQLGNPYQLSLYAMPGYASNAQGAISFLSLSPSLPPIDIRPFGLFGLDLASAVPLPNVPISSPTGVATVVVPVPNWPSLRNQTIHVQALMMHTPALGTWRLTNVHTDIIQ